MSPLSYILNVIFSKWFDCLSRNLSIPVRYFHIFGPLLPDKNRTTESRKGNLTVKETNKMSDIWHGLWLLYPPPLRRIDNLNETSLKNIQYIGNFQSKPPDPFLHRMCNPEDTKKIISLLMHHSNEPIAHLLIRVFTLPFHL